MKNWKAHLAIFTANLIYGINYTVAKGVMPALVKPFGFVFMRIGGAALLFWLIAFSKDEKIKKEDWPRLLICAFFGVGFNQVMFFKGLSMTTAINSAILMVITPILVLIFSTILLKETISKQKIAGIFLGLTGALSLILKDGFSYSSEGIWGDFFIFINAISYAIYLALVKPLMFKYHPFTIMKYCFALVLPFILPLGYAEFREIDWLNMPQHAYWAILYVVIFVTFLAYLLNTLALSKVNPSLVSVYIYSQPLLAALVAVIIGEEQINLSQIASAAFIFSGVYLVSINSGK